MIDVNALRKGTTFTHENELYRVLDYTHNKTGRGGAKIWTKLKKHWTRPPKNMQSVVTPKRS